MYKRLPEKPTVYCDVDNTLILWDKPITAENQDELIHTLGYPVFPHHKHINLLQQFKARGHTVVVWSAGGADWAERVVNLLGLEEIVDIILPKPHWYIDDLSSSEFLPEHNRVYLKDEV